MKEIIKDKDGKVIKVRTINTDPTKTQIHQQESTDINKIMERYKKTGELVHVNRKAGVYMDLTSAPDYQTALDKVIKANDAFMALPSKTRLRFNNNPQELLAFLKDPKNRDEAVQLELLEPPPPVVNPPLPGDKK